MKFKYSAVSTLIIVTSALTMPSTAFAAKADFERCDGLLAPKKKTIDGMREPAWTRKTIIARLINPARCTRALEDKRLLPNHTLRRINLLFFRAIAYSQEKEFDKAQADVDQAKKLSTPYQNDKLYMRSMGASLDLLNAALLNQADEKTTAIALINNAISKRSYDRAILLSTNSLLIGQSERQASYEKFIRVSPGNLRNRFNYFINNGDFKNAAIDYEQMDIKFAKYVRRPAASLRRLNLDNIFLVLNTETSAKAAYAYAAIGQSDRATEILVKTQEKLDKSFKTDDENIAETAIDISNQRSFKRINQTMSDWTNYVNIRNSATAGDAPTAIKNMIATELPDNEIGLDIINAVYTISSDDQKDLLPNRADFQTKVNEKKISNFSYRSFSTSVPFMERDSELTSFKQDNISILKTIDDTDFSKLKGTTFKKNDDGDTVITYSSVNASPTVASDLALLSAASLAKAQNSGGFIILMRSDHSNSGVNLFKNRINRSGNKTEITVRFVEEAAFNDETKFTQDRFINANAIYSSLASIYIDK